MKRTAILITLYCLAFPTLLSAQETYTGETRDAIDGRGISSLQVDLGNGFTVILRGSDTDSISYHYVFEGNRLAHERNFNQAEFRLERQGATAMLSIQFPELEQMRRTTNQSWLQRLFGSDIRNFNIEKQELRVDMPRDLALRLATRYSNVDLSGVERDLEVTTRSGTVEVRDVGGNVTVSNEYGNAVVEQVGGSLQITSRSSDISVRAVEGETRINSPYSNVSVTDAGSRVSLQTQSGTVDVGQIRGPLDVEANYTEMNISEVEGSVSVRSRSGSLTVSNVPTLDFAGEYTDLRVRNLTGRGANTIGNRSAKVDLANIAGETRITGEYLEIGLSRFTGPVLHIRNRSGDVNVESTSTLSEVDIQVVYGDVRFTLGAEYNGRFAFSTRYGDLNLGGPPFDVEFETDQPDTRIQNVTGTVGTAVNNYFRIENRNGDITVTAEY